MGNSSSTLTATPTVEAPPAAVGEDFEHVEVEPVVVVLPEQGQPQEVEEEEGMTAAPPVLEMVIPSDETLVSVASGFCPGIIFEDYLHQVSCQVVGVLCRFNVEPEVHHYPSVEALVEAVLSRNREVAASDLSDADLQHLDRAAALVGYRFDHGKTAPCPHHPYAWPRPCSVFVDFAVEAYYPQFGCTYQYGERAPPVARVTLFAREDAAAFQLLMAEAGVAVREVVRQDFAWLAGA
jgi:hypothetical protein